MKFSLKFNNLYNYLYGLERAYINLIISQFQNRFNSDLVKNNLKDGSFIYNCIQNYNDYINNNSNNYIINIIYIRSQYLIGKINNKTTFGYIHDFIISKVQIL